MRINYHSTWKFRRYVNWIDLCILQSVINALCLLISWNFLKQKVHLLFGLSRSVRFFAAPWTATHQAPLPLEFSRQEYWSGVSFPTPEDLPDPGPEPTSLVSPAVAGRFFSTSATKEAPFTYGLTWIFYAIGNLFPSTWNPQKYEC